jgi:hypothetical protein
MVGHAPTLDPERFRAVDAHRAGRSEAARHGGQHVVGRAERNSSAAVFGSELTIASTAGSGCAKSGSVTTPAFSAAAGVLGCCADAAADAATTNIAAILQKCKSRIVE